MSDEKTQDEQLEEHALRRKLASVTRDRDALRDEVLKLRDAAKVVREVSESQVKQAISPTSGAGSKRHGTAVMLWSDWHVEEVVEAEKTNDLNSYSLDIADQRIDSLVQGCVWLMDMHATRYHLDSAIVWLGGDLITGWIHEELVETNVMSPIEATLWLKARLTGALEHLAARAPTDNIVVVCSPGNHGRSTAKRRVANYAETSFEWAMYCDLATRFKNHAKIHLHASRAVWDYADVYDYRIRFGHGDQIAYQGGVGGLTIPLNKAVARLNEGRRADWTCIGHYHQLGFYPGAVVNGSLIGQTPYGMKFGYEPPQQAYFLVDAERGRTAHHAVWVEAKGQRKVEHRETPRREQWDRWRIIRPPA